MKHEVERIFRMKARGDVPSLKAVVGLERATIYKKIRAGEFPPGIRLGARARGWPESQIRQWLKEREAAE